MKSMAFGTAVHHCHIFADLLVLPLSRRGMCFPLTSNPSFLYRCVSFVVQRTCENMEGYGGEAKSRCLNVERLTFPRRNRNLSNGWQGWAFWIRCSRVGYVSYSRHREPYSFICLRIQWHRNKRRSVKKLLVRSKESLGKNFCKSSKICERDKHISIYVNINISSISFQSENFHKTFESQTITHSTPILRDKTTHHGRRRKHEQSPPLGRRKLQHQQQCQHQQCNHLHRLLPPQNPTKPRTPRSTPRRPLRRRPHARLHGRNPRSPRAMRPPQQTHRLRKLRTPNRTNRQRK